MLQCAYRHKGPTLIEQLAAVDTPKRISDRPLRVVLFAAKHEEQKMICQGRVEYGNLRSGMVCPRMSGYVSTFCRELHFMPMLLQHNHSGYKISISIPACMDSSTEQCTMCTYSLHSTRKTFTVPCSKLFSCLEV
jgi:translation elongation factor EF-1alpha